MKIANVLSSLALFGLVAGAVAVPEKSAFAANMNYVGDWVATTVYPAGRTITFNNRLYYSLQSTKAAPNRGYQPDKFPNSWQPVGTIANTLLSGIGAPDNSIGQGGDFYIDYQNNRLFGPKNAVSGWAAESVSLAGAVGERGPVGFPGLLGERGPSGAQGPAGPAGAQGPAGPAGADGAVGPAGATGATGPAPMIVDANNAVVGEFVNGDAWVVTPAGKRSLNRVNPNGYSYQGQPFIYFASNDCTGTPYSSNLNPFDIGRILGMVPSGILVPDSDVAPFIGRFFFPVGGVAVGVALTPQSLIQSGQATATCTVLVSPPLTWSGFGYELGVINVTWQAPVRVQ